MICYLIQRDRFSPRLLFTVSPKESREWTNGVSKRGISGCSSLAVASSMVTVLPADSGKKTAFGSGVTPSVLPGVCVGLIELFLGAGIAASPQNCFRDAGNGQRRRSPNESVSDQWL